MRAPSRMATSPSVYSQIHSSDVSSDSSSTNFPLVEKPLSGFHDVDVLAPTASASTHSTSTLSHDRLFTFEATRSSSASTPSRDRLFTFQTTRSDSSTSPSREKPSSDQTTPSTTVDSLLTENVQLHLSRTPATLSERLPANYSQKVFDMEHSLTPNLNSPHESAKRSSPRSRLPPSSSTPHFALSQQPRSVSSSSTSNLTLSRQQRTTRSSAASPSTPNFSLPSSPASPSSLGYSLPQQQQHVSFASPPTPNLSVPPPSTLLSPSSPDFFTVPQRLGSTSSPNLRHGLKSKPSIGQKVKGGLSSFFRRDKSEPEPKRKRPVIGNPQGFEHFSGNSPYQHRTVAGPKYAHSIHNQDMSSPTEQSGPGPKNKGSIDQDMSSSHQQFAAAPKDDAAVDEDIPSPIQQSATKYHFAAPVNQDMASPTQQAEDRFMNEPSFNRDMASPYQQTHVTGPKQDVSIDEETMSPGDRFERAAALYQQMCADDQPSEYQFTHAPSFGQHPASPAQQSGPIYELDASVEASPTYHLEDQCKNEASMRGGSIAVGLSQSPSSPPVELYNSDGSDADDVKYQDADEDAYEGDVKDDASVSALDDSNADAASAPSSQLDQPEPERYMSPAERTALELGLELDFSDLHIPTPAEREARRLGLAIDFKDVMRMNAESSANDRIVRQYTDVPASYYAFQRSRPVYSGASITSAKSPAAPAPKVIGQWACCQCDHVQDLFLHDEGEHLVSILRCACPHRSCENCSLYGAIKLYTPVQEPFAVQLSETDEKIKFGVFCSDCGLSWRAQAVKGAPTVMEKISAVPKSLGATVGAAVKGAKAMHNVRGESASTAKSSWDLRQLSSEMEKEHGKQADSCLVFFSGIKCTCGNVLGTSCLGFQLVEGAAAEEEKVVKEAPTFMSTPEDRAKGIGKETLTLLDHSGSRVRHANPLMGNPV